MSKRNSKKTIHVGTITGRESLLSSPKGPRVKIGGCGAHDSRPKRQRTRRNRDDAAIRDAS